MKTFVTRHRDTYTLIVAALVPILALAFIIGLFKNSLDDQHRQRHNDKIAALEQQQVRLNSCNVTDGYNGVIVDVFTILSKEGNDGTVSPDVRHGLDILIAKNSQRDVACRKSADSVLIGK